MNRFRPVPPYALSLRRALSRIARSAVPPFADFCLVYLAAGSSITCVAAAHATEQGRRLLRALGRTYRIRQDDRSSTVATVIATGQAALRKRIRPDPLSAGTNAVTDLHRALAPRSALVVPIAWHARTLGAVTLCYADSGRGYSARDLPAAQDLAARVEKTLLFTSYPDDRLRSATGRARQGTTVRRRVAARD